VGAVSSAEFSPDGKNVVTMVCDGDTVKGWKVETGAVIASLNHQGEVEAAEFSPDGKKVLTACADNTANIRGLATEAILASCKLSPYPAEIDNFKRRSQAYSVSH
jgi:WD40 repeat protein